MGIVSAKGRADLGIVDYEDFIQTDAAINPGNSGGALVNMEGQLVGVNTAILSRSGGYQGIGFAIPTNMASPIMEALKKDGRVVRGWLGVGIQDVDGELATAMKLPVAHGVLLSDVRPDAPAARAGLKRGDVVTTVEGTGVTTTGAFRNLIAAATPQKTITLEIFRGGKREKLPVVVGTMPDDVNRAAPGQGSSGGPATLDGLTVAPLDDTARKRLSVPPNIRSGLVVNAVDPGSPAAVADLRPGDVLLELDKQPITSERDLSDRLAKKQGPAALLVWRDSRTFYAVLKP